MLPRGSLGCNALECSLVEPVSRLQQHQVCAEKGVFCETDIDAFVPCSEVTESVFVLI